MAISGSSLLKDHKYVPAGGGLPNGLGSDERRPYEARPSTPEVMSATQRYMLQEQLRWHFQVLVQVSLLDPNLEHLTSRA